MIRNRFVFYKPILFTFFIMMVSFLLTGCSREKDTDGLGRTIISVWFHTGRPEEKQVMENQVKRFNESQDKIKVRLTLIPEGDYNTQIQAAAADGKLPDLLDLDGPYVYNYAWKKHLIPIDHLLPHEIKKDLLPSIIEQGTYRGKLYAIGTFDSGLGLYGNRKFLSAVAAHIPTGPQNAWKIDEFEKILAALAQKDKDGKVLDLRMDYRGEWFTYAFSPAIHSGGGDLINRDNFQNATGILNGPSAVKAMQHIKVWFAKQYVDPNTDTNSFVNGRVALSWCGHWEYPRYSTALGNDLVVLPLPDFGNGTKTGMGSWCWSITSNCKNPQRAMQFLLFLLRPTEILAMCRANGAVPARKSAIAASTLYQDNGPLHLFARQLEGGYAVPRPQTPAYPVITSVFQQAFQDIRHGRDVKQALDQAASMINQDIKDNKGYPDL